MSCLLIPLHFVALAGVHFVGCCAGLESEFLVIFNLVFILSLSFSLSLPPAYDVANVVVYSECSSERAAVGPISYTPEVLSYYAFW